VTEQVLDRYHLDNLIEAMLQVPGVADTDVRDIRVDELKQLLRRPLSTNRFADSRLDLSALISSCLACSGGLRTLAEVLRRHDPSEASSHVLTLVDGIVGSGLLSPPDRETLQNHLTGVAVGQIATAVGELVGADQLRSLETWRDLPAAIRLLESLPVREDGVAQLVTFIDRLANLVGERKAADLNRWVDMVVGGLAVNAEQLAMIRADNQRSLSPGRLAPAAPAQRDGSWAEPSSPRANRTDESGLIWGGVPIRNRNFSGRVALLERLGQALRTSSKASVLPQTLHGMGGVGKSQLVIEYVYRHMAEYDIVWWISSEQTASVLSSLAQLADRLGLPTTEDRQQTARTVLDALAGTELSWLLVYDNADDPATLDQYVPSTGGHVVVTTRNQEWANLGQAIEVDVFERSESIELLQRRSQGEGGSPRIQTAQADVLAEKLGDLPLALEQAVAWYLATSMPINEYIELLDSHIKDLLSEGKPANYPLTVAAFVTLAVDQLRETAPAAAQLFELFAYLGGEPVAVSLLRKGSFAEVAEPLRTMLASSIPTNRTVRDLNRYGLAKVDALQRVQVHRLVQLVLRDSLTPELARQSLRNTQLLLAKANPGDPDENPDAPREDLGPHIEPADLIHASDLDARQAVLDHSRYLWMTGDYENSLSLADRAARAWEQDASHPRLGREGELTLLARAQAANAKRTLGFSAEAAELARETYDLMRRNPHLGPDHEFTLITGNQVGADLRIAGRYREALEFDRESVARHREVFEADSSYTLRAQANLAVDYRMIGDFAEAFVLDREIAARWEDVRASDPRALAAYINLARSCYGLGAYRLGLELLERWQHLLQLSLGAGNSQVLLVGRTRAILLRKLGRLDEAMDVIRDNEERMEKRFRSSHEFAVAATVSHANVLREKGQVEDAAEAIGDALERYLTYFGPRHPLTLVAQVNAAIIHRARGEWPEARALDESCYRALVEVLAPDHPYAICAGVGLATDLARVGEHEAAAELSRRMYTLGRASSGGGHEARDGAEHPYVLMRGVNLSYDLRATGEVDEAQALFEDSVAGLRRSLGGEHPEVLAIERGMRAESDIEPPPT